MLSGFTETPYKMIGAVHVAKFWIYARFRIRPTPDQFERIIGSTIFNMPIEYDAIIVGSGPNGLAAAIALARAGCSVLVCEANATIGGGARSAELTLPGFVHDGWSAVHPLAAGSPFFKTLPLHQFGLTWIQPEIPLAHPLDDGTAACLYRDVDLTADSLGADSRAYRRLMKPLARDWEKLATEFLQPMLHLPRHPIALARFGIPALFPTT